MYSVVNSLPIHGSVSWSAEVEAMVTRLRAEKWHYIIVMIWFHYPESQVQEASPTTQVFVLVFPACPAGTRSRITFAFTYPTPSRLFARSGLATHQRLRVSVLLLCL